MDHVLKVESLGVRLSQGARIVDGVSFAIGKAETYALLGESGCGKSLTALALLRLLPEGVETCQGRVDLGDVELLSLSESEMRDLRGRRMSMIFQDPGSSLNPVLTVGQQIGEVLALHFGLKGAAAQARMLELLQQVGIPDPARRLDEYPFQFSGGMRQRVMIAMALAGNPSLLLADEPTTALDVTIQAQVLALLREAQDATGMSMLLITHDLGVVAQTAHRVGVMYAGQIVEQAGREQLFAHPLHPYTRKLFAALPDAATRGAALAAIPGSVPSPAAMPAGCRFAPRCDQAWSLCHERAPGWTEVSDGVGVRCHLYACEGKEREVVGAAVSAPVDGHASLGPEAAEVLRVRDLKVHFPIRRGILQHTAGHVYAVDGISFDLKAGRTLALVGESGCGKTTVGKALLQLIRPTAGSVRFGGEELVGAGKSELRTLRAGMQMVFQDPYASLNPKLRVCEILEEGMRALGIGRDAARRGELMDRMLVQVGLDVQAQWRYPHEFSGGQRQRIAIARALMVEPKLLICDEPTSALDVSVQAQILNLLMTLQQKLGLSYLFITHNLSVVRHLAHEVCVMYLGRIVEYGEASQVMEQPLHPYTRALLDAAPRLDGVRGEVLKVSGDLPSPAAPPSGCHFHPRCPRVMPVCRTDYPEARGQAGGRWVRCHLYP
jgi:peptide/nickel transport system ATP-binding protein